MDILWSPWRFHYVSEGVKKGGCVFCEKAAADRSRDRENLVLYRGQSNYILLNLYPYTTGPSLPAAADGHKPPALPIVSSGRWCE